MKKISKAEATRLTGEAMGWKLERQKVACNGCIVKMWIKPSGYEIWAGGWNPLDNLDHAKDMLEAICEEKSWEANVLLDKDGLYHIDIQSEDDAGWGFCRETVTHGSAWGHKDLTTALVLACLEAKFGVKYEIED